MVFVTNADNKSDAIRHMSERIGVKPVWMDVVDSPDYGKLLYLEFAKAEMYGAKAVVAPKSKYLMWRWRHHMANARACVKAFPVRGRTNTPRYGGKNPRGDSNG